MNPTFQRLLAETTRLTRSGNLHGATAAIQAALRGIAAPARPAGSVGFAGFAGRGAVDVMDVEAREVATQRGLGASAAQVRPTPTRTPSTQGAGAGKFIAGRFTDSNGTRDYKLYIPPGDGGAGDAGRAIPLVVMLRGCTQNPDDFAAGTEMNDSAREGGFCVL